MLYSASPVFAVQARGDWAPTWLSGRVVPALLVLGLFVVLGGVAAWLVTRPNAAEVPMEPVPVAKVPEAKSKPPADEPSFDDPPAPKALVPPTEDPPAPKTAPKVEPPPPKVAVDPKPTPAPATTNNPPPAKPPIKAEALFDAFDLDAAKARAKHGNQPVTLVIRGKLLRDNDGKTYFGGVVVKPGTPPAVLCYVTADDAAKLEGVPADRDVTLNGICEGRRDDAGAFLGYVVVVRECVVAK